MVVVAERASARPLQGGSDIFEGTMNIAEMLYMLYMLQKLV